MTTETIFPYEPFKDQVPAPPTTNDGDVCLRFDLKWIPYVFGALKALAYAQTYTSDRVRAVNEANEMIARAMELAECGMDCGDIQFNIDEFGHLIFTCEGNDIDLGNVIGPQGEKGDTGDTGPQGIQGEQGPQGEKGDPGDEGRDGVFGDRGTTETNPDIPSLTCAKSTWLRDYIHEKWGDVLDGIELAVDIGKTIAEVSADVINIFLQFTVIGDEALNAAEDLVEGAVEATTDLLRASDTEEFQEFVRCCIHCALLDNNGEVGNTWEAAIGPAIDCIASNTTSIIGPVYALMMTAIALQTYQLQAALARNESSSCAPCEDCPEILLSYDQGTGPLHASVGETIIITPTNHSEFSGYSQFAVHIDPPCNVRWVSGDVVNRPGAGLGGVDFAWSKGGSSTAYYVDNTGLDAASVNAHQGEAHDADLMSSTDGQNAGPFHLKFESINP